MKSLLKKVLSYFWIIFGIGVGVAVAHIFLPSKIVYVGKPYPVKDSIAIDLALERTQKIAGDSIASLWDKISGLQKRIPPTGYYGTPGHDPYPPREFKINTKDSMLILNVMPSAIDAPISLVVNKTSVTITTRNAWNFGRGEPYIKAYRWPRLARDFSFGLTETTDYGQLNGINLYFDRRWFEFDNFGILAGAEFPRRCYVGVDARFIFWEKLEISPRLTSVPALAIEGRWRF
jgi:hypothetical protein